jgi:phospholipid/cholesterol/gamma-HCH transport system permease protein
MKFLQNFGEYILFLKAVFTKPEKLKIFRQQIITESYNIGNSSYGIIALISTFIGAVSTIQIGYQFEGSLLPDYLIGRIVRDSNILEFAPTITALVLGGKVGSSIASEIGTMKVTEQIDAMEVSAINPFKYLVVTRVIATSLTIPILALYCSFVGLLGSYVNVNGSESSSLTMFYKNAFSAISFLDIFASVVKSIFYGFTIGMVGCYKGYYATQGTRGVGKAANEAVVLSMFLIFVEEIIIVQVSNWIRLY